MRINKKEIAAFFTLFCLFSLTGCSVLNPYDSEFLCPDVSTGTCTSVENAYEKSLGVFENGYEKSIGALEDDQSQSTNATINRSEQRNNLLAAIIPEPGVPIVTPPEIARVLILPYSVSNGSSMYGARYAYIIVKQASFNVLATNKINE